LAVLTIQIIGNISNVHQFEAGDKGGLLLFVVMYTYDIRPQLCSYWKGMQIGFLASPIKKKAEYNFMI